MDSLSDKKTKAHPPEGFKSAESFKSAIYTGLLRHRRFSPKHHEFIYKVFMMYVDLSEIDRICALSPWWSSSRWALARFKRQDFLGDDSIPLDQAVRARIKESVGVEHTGPIRLLANWRYWGLAMNPIATYYCFDETEQLQYIVAEVTNTPWKERVSYVLNCDPDKKRQRIIFSKAMHVSPFNPMAMDYHWCSNNPGKRLSLAIDTHQQGQCIVDASLTLERQDITSRGLNKVIWQYPWMTLKVAAAIYWQAIKLWYKGVPICDHPDTDSTDTDKIDSINSTEKTDINFER